MRRRLLASLAATAAVAASLLIGSAGSAGAATAAAPEAAVDSASAASRGGGVTPNADLPPDIQVDDPNLKIVATLRGVGKQVYDCKNGLYVGREPVATLSTLRGTPVGIHGVGPFWASFDGSRVKAAKVAEAAAPGRGSNIAWLKLQANENAGQGGVFSSVQFVQRIDTKGGVPPTSCTGAKTLAVDYSTNYVFWAPK